MVSLAGDLDVQVDAIVSTNQHFGYSIGSSIGAALATAWDGISSGEQVVIIHAGDGLWSGSVLLASD
jgi:3-oxoacyl-[acyl-carrier-protein] synthase III